MSAPDPFTFARTLTVDLPDGSQGWRTLVLVVDRTTGGFSTVWIHDVDGIDWESTMTIAINHAHDEGFGE